MIYRMGQRVTRSLVNHPVGFQLANYIRRALKAFSQSGELHLTTYQDHLRMWVDLSDFVGSTIYFYDFTPGDRGLIPFLKQHVRNTDVIIDVGAHIGMITLLAAYLAPQGSVHSFEASKDNFRLLQRNVDANDLPNVRLNHKALWHTSTTLDLFTKNSNNSGTFSLFKAEGWELEAHSIEAITLDSYVFSEDQPLARVDLIKIDIEGADLWTKQKEPA